MNDSNGISLADKATDIASALNYVNPTDRDLWVRMAMAIKSELNQDGFEVWDCWSQRAHNYESRAALSVWKSIKAGGKVNIESQYWAAKHAGWSRSTQLTNPSQEELAARKVRQQKLAAEAALQERIKHEQAAEMAQQIWAAATPTETHPYLTTKGVQVSGLRIGRWEVTDTETGKVTLISEQALLVPIKDRTNKLHSLQAIFPSNRNSLGRDKDYLNGGAKKGFMFSIGKACQYDGKSVFIICEGLATGASLHDCTGHMVLIAFDASNLLSVATKVREHQPDAIILIAADNDQWTVKQDGTPFNPGVTAAIKASEAVNGRVCIPDFQNIDLHPTDFNDLHQLEGDKVVQDIITAALEAPEPLHELDSEPDPQAEEITSTTLVKEDSLADELVYDDKNPMQIARDMIGRFWNHPGGRSILHRGGEFVTWNGKHYNEYNDGDLRARIYKHLEHARKLKKSPAKGDSSSVSVPFKPNRQNVTDVIDAIRAVANEPTEIPVPSWLHSSDNLPSVEEILPCANGLLHLPSGRLLPHTPNLFNFNSLPFNYDPFVPEPTEWLKFLQTLWPDDEESIEVLQMIFGYLLTSDTSLQKIFLLIGPPRCGKGTILRILEELLGKSNTCAADINNLSERFALEGFIGKQAALVGDARLSPKADLMAIAGRLLSISGEDAVSIDRKNKPVWFGTLKARFVICSNLVPTLNDPSDALASRFVILTMKHSFLGKEDINLGAKLKTEMPGILKWAIEGRHKLLTTGRIQTPKTAMDNMQELSDLASPIRMFIREKCNLTGGNMVDTKCLYAAWQQWCMENGHKHYGSSISFGRDLRAAVPGIARKQVRLLNNQRTWCYEGVSLASTYIQPPI